jgi:hypothetical protein
VIAEFDERSWTLFLISESVREAVALMRLQHTLSEKKSADKGKLAVSVSKGVMLPIRIDQGATEFVEPPTREEE